MAASRALVSLLLVASCALVAAAPATVVSQKTYFQPLGRAIFGNPAAPGPCSNTTGQNYLDIDLAPGSGSFVIGDNLWTITDRGANLDCQGGNAPGGAAGTTLSAACQATNTACTAAGKVFPLPNFAPTIQRWKLPDVFTAANPVPVETITLKKLNGQTITGWPNFDNQDNITTNPNRVLLTGEGGYGPDFQKLGPDPFSLDTEGIVVTSANADGTGATFWVSEEYGPSIAQVASDGRILGRHVPAGVVFDAYNARAAPALAANPTNGYPIYPTFPSILVKRELNRGMENLAYFGKYLYTILQSPLANPTVAIGRQSLIARIYKLELDATAPGGAKLIGEYVYFLEKVGTFPQDAGASQSAIKLGEATAIAEDVLLVDEHVTLQTKLFRIDLKGATNILGSKWDDVLQSPTLEQLEPASSATPGSALAANGIVPVQKVLAFDSFTDDPPSSGQPQLPVKIEATGIFGNPLDAANPAQLILINDNDFGIAADLTRFTLFNVASSVYQSAAVAPAPAPVTATPTPTPTGTPTATPTPTPTPVNCISTFTTGTCDFASAAPNQCFNNAGSSYTCCAGSCGSPPGPVAYCTGQVPGTTPVCGATPAPTSTGTSAPTGTPVSTTGAPVSTTGAPAATTGAPAATTAAPTPGPTAFAVGGTCDAGSSLPNQCFNDDGSKYICCPAACGTPPAALPFCA